MRFRSLYCGHFRILLASLLLLALTGCTHLQDMTHVDLSERVSDEELVAHAQDDDALKVGFDPRLDPYEEARIYAPLLRYLEESTGYQFSLRFTRENECIVENLGAGVIDFALMGGVNSVRAHESFGTTCIVRGLNAEGSDSYRSAIVVSPDSPITSLEDAQGKHFAFGDEGSTQGFLILATRAQPKVF